MNSIRARMPWLLAGAVLTGQGQAAEYVLDGGVSLGQQYNSNLLWQPNATPEWGTIVEGQGALSMRGENWGSNGKLRLQNYFYAPDNTITHQNQYLDGGGYYLTERSRFQLSGNFTDDYLLASQNFAATGLILGMIQRNLKSVGPSWSYSLTERSQATLGYYYFRSEYFPVSINGQEALSNAYPDSDNHTAFAKLAYRQTEQLTLIGDLSYTAFLADSSKSYTSPVSEASGIPIYSSYRNIQYFTFALAAEYNYDPSLEFRASAGGQYSHTGASYSTFPIFLGDQLVNLGPPPVFEPYYFVARSNSPAWDSISPIFAVSGQKQFERDRASFGFTRQIMPSINGVLLVTDRASIANQHEFLEGLVGSLSFAFTQQDYPSAGTTVDGNAITGSRSFSFFQVDAGFTYQWTRHWSVTGSYRYTERRLDVPDTANMDSNQVSLTLNYTFDPFKF